MAIKNMAQAKLEWDAWQEVVKSLKDLGVDINEQDKLAESMQEWGQQFHLLQKDILI